MFHLRRAAPEITWKSIEDDFVIGTCTRRIFAYASRDIDRVWTAFDDDAHPLGRFARLIDAKAALWAAHRDGHDTVCAKSRDRRPPQPPGPASDRSFSETPPRDGAHRGSW